MLRKIARLLEILSEPGVLRGLVSLRNNFSVSSFHVNARVATYQPVFHTIIDAGANVGQFAIAAAQRFPMAEIYCFEPVPDVYEILKSNTKEFTNITVYKYAVGSTTGKIPFYRNDYTPASSAMVIRGEHNRPNCEQKRTKTIEVDIFRLDDLVSTLEINIKQPALLKLDVQGYEKDVLQGAEKTLGCIDYIALEASFVQLYENQLLFNELHEWLKSIGFELIAPLDATKGANRAIVEMDVLYRRVKQKGSANQ